MNSFDPAFLSPSELWGKHYFDCSECQLPESFTEQEQQLCDEGLRLRNEALADMHPTFIPADEPLPEEAEALRVPCPIHDFKSGFCIGYCPDQAKAQEEAEFEPTPDGIVYLNAHKFLEAKTSLVTAQAILDRILEAIKKEEKDLDGPNT